MTGSFSGEKIEHGVLGQREHTTPSGCVHPNTLSVISGVVGIVAASWPRGVKVREYVSIKHSISKNDHTGPFGIAVEPTAPSVFLGDGIDSAAVSLHTKDGATLPVSTGRPSATHFGSPPSKITTLSRPITLSVQKALGEEYTPAESYTTTTRGLTTAVSQPFPGEHGCSVGQEGNCGTGPAISSHASFSIERDKLLVRSEE
eukprot:GHVT01004506.1.p2 GENE.GHVT01004506.1~~GHVT01004506.1.p2  ORF type:complete len:202 (+),score=14.69 GHVT01004506.1:1183-1788(+)